MIVCKLSGYSGYTILQMFLTWQLPVKSGQSRTLEWRTDKQSGGDQITRLSPWCHHTKCIHVGIWLLIMINKQHRNHPGINMLVGWCVFIFIQNQKSLCQLINIFVMFIVYVYVPPALVNSFTAANEGKVLAGGGMIISCEHSNEGRGELTKDWWYRMLKKWNIETLFNYTIYLLFVSTMLLKTS